MRVFVVSRLRPISRLLYPLRSGDHLSVPSVTRWNQAAHPALFAGRVAPMRLLGLAPGGVCLAADITARAGGLLHHRFTLARFRAIYLSVALSVGLLRPAVSRHRTLWRADFPPPAESRERSPGQPRHPLIIGLAPCVGKRRASSALELLNI